MNTKPFIATRDLVVFPNTIVPLFIGREQSLNSLQDAIQEDHLIVLAMQKKPNEENPDLNKGIYKVGVLGKVIQKVELPNQTIKAIIEIESRVIIGDIERTKKGDRAKYDIIRSKEIPSDKSPRLFKKILKEFESYLKMNAKIIGEESVPVNENIPKDKLLDLISTNLFIASEEKQKLLECFSEEERAYKLLEILKEEKELLELENEIEERVRERINQAQRNYYLREKINTIKDELNEDIPEDDDLLELQNELKKIKPPKYVKDKIKKELKKLAKMPSFSSEATVTRSYITTLLELPWNKKTKDMLDIAKAQKILDEDHYGLEKVKERILEYLAVKSLNPEMKGSIICLVGPPGVGKTSLAKSVASAMGRNFSRVSLGGVRDESEIRGHRRTYVGSMPGRMIKSIIEAKSKNPLILLDEIDKMSSDFKGDPASAMLEVLDPEQNSHFEDHYLDLKFDLSKVFFIATANDLRTIPGPLRDRMEIIELSSYTEVEKLHIAKRYLLPEAKIENGLGDIKLTISDSAVMRIINEFTREAGVRTLKREINKLHRKIAKEVISNKNNKISVTKNNLEDYLGKVRFRPDKMRRKEKKLGLVNGLAWTAMGGTTLEVEGVATPGKGKLVLTGTLGDVMKESAHVASTFVKANVKTLKLQNKDYAKDTDIHLHFPEGATPKDGPSAGITITTTIVSILSERPVKQNIAMTGEITIRGEVLPVGGIKEKVIGAHRVGIREVILPFDNKSDVDEIPEEISKDMTFYFAKTYRDVEKIVF